MSAGPRKLRKRLSTQLNEKNPEDKQKVIIGYLEDLLANGDEVSEKLEGLTDNLKSLTESVKENSKANKEALEKLAQLESKVQSLEHKLETKSAENVRLNNDLSRLHEKVIKLESHSRRDNLIFDGVVESEPDNCTHKVLKIMRTKMEIADAHSIRIVRCHRMPTVDRRPSTQKSKPRPVIIKFHWFGDREHVWKQRRKLAGSNIWVNEDFPAEIKNRQKILRPIARKAKEQGKNAFINVDTLVLDGQQFNVNNLDRLPADLNPAQVATPLVGNDKRAFFGGQSPLSNFHDAPFTLNGKRFEHSEKCYQYHCAIALNNNRIAAEILSAKSPYDCYRLGLQLNKDDDWKKREALKIMYDTCYAKFSQNDHLKKFLLDTGDAILIEASPRDRFWGVGTPLSDRQNLSDPTKWRGQNNLGKILRQIRDELRQ